MRVCVCACAYVCGYDYMYLYNSRVSLYMCRFCGGTALA
nr:MAG TPA: restriction alleviation protein [Bacteriophage sp.]